MIYRDVMYHSKEFYMIWNHVRVADKPRRTIETPLRRHCAHYDVIVMSSHSIDLVIPERLGFNTRRVISQNAGTFDK